jgi:hypothetical protein
MTILAQRLKKTEVDSVPDGLKMSKKKKLLSEEADFDVVAEGIAVAA